MNGHTSPIANGHSPFANGHSATSFQARVRAMLYGAAYGDALGAVVEKLSASQIKEIYGKVDTLDTAWWRETQSDMKRKGRIRGHGIITDDTLMTLCVMEVYKQEKRHLDAWDVSKGLVREIMWTPRWIPEMQKTTMLQERLWYAEKWLFHRHQMVSCDPRQGGIGNQVNCGAAMCIAPIGAVNAGNPRAAYDEAIAFASAHQESYGLEAAGVLAAGVAAAFVPGANMDDVVAAAIDVAKDGTRSAIVDMVDAARDLREAPYDYDAIVAKFHEVILKYSPAGDDVDYNIEKAGIPSAMYRPSRFGAIEELPIALGFAVLHDGDFYKTIIDGVNSGRDTDSIGVMAGCILGALHGESIIRPHDLVKLNTANRFDLMESADEFVAVARKIQRDDDALWERVRNTRRVLA